MEYSTDTKKRVMKYLLGELDEPDLISFEEKFLTNPLFFSEFYEIETDLIDEYARGFLSQPDKTLLEKCFKTSPHMVRRVRVANVLLAQMENVATSTPNLIATTPPPRKTFVSIGNILRIPFLKPALAFAAIAIFAVIGIKLYTGNNTSPDISKDITTSQTPYVVTAEPTPGPSIAQNPIRRTNEQVPPTGKPAPPPDSQIAMLTLTGHTLRGNGKDDVPTILISKTISEIDLKVKMEDLGYSKFKLSIKSSDDKLIFEAENLKPKLSGPIAEVSVLIKSDVLTVGTYSVIISSTDKDGNAFDLSNLAFKVVF